MKTNKRKHNWIVDAVLFIGFLVVMFSDLTGLAAHEWLGLAVILLSGYHLLLHGQWVKAITRQFFSRMKGQTRLTYVVDACLLIGFLGIGVTGLVTSTWLNLPLDNYVTWKDIHVLGSIVTLAILVLKIGLHWRWIALVARQDLFSPPSPQQNLAPRPVPVANTISRRDFLRVMGFVGATAAVTGFVAATNLSGVTTASTAAKTETTSSTTAVAQNNAQTATTSSASYNTSSTTSSTSSTAATCTPCHDQCSYPGKCRRYVDSNGNGKCDNGECSA